MFRMDDLYTIFEEYYNGLMRRGSAGLVDAEDGPLDLLDMPPAIRKKFLQKLSYGDLGRMEETCAAINYQIKTDKIRPALKVNTVKYSSGFAFIENENGDSTPITVFSDSSSTSANRLETTFHKHCIDQRERISNVFIAPLSLEIDCTLSEIDVERMSWLLKDKHIPVVKLGNTLYYGFINVQRLPQVCERESFFALLQRLKTEKFICHWKMNEIDLLRPEIQELHAIDLWGTVRPSLSIATLQEMRNPVIKVQYEDITNEHLKAILNDWQAGTRDIKYFLTSGNFNQAEVLANITAYPIWTDDTQHQRILDFLKIHPHPNSKRRPVDILVMKRRNRDQMGDFLLLFFRMLKFAAATVEGIEEEKLQEEIKLDEAGAGEWEFYRK